MASKMVDSMKFVPAQSYLGVDQNCPAKKHVHVDTPKLAQPNHLTSLGGISSGYKKYISEKEQTNKREEGLKGLGTCRKLRDVDYGCSETVKLQGIHNELEMTSLAQKKTHKLGVKSKIEKHSIKQNPSIAESRTNISGITSSEVINKLINTEKRGIELSLLQRKPSVALHHRKATTSSSFTVTLISSFPTKIRVDPPTRITSSNIIEADICILL
ncbi:hypothetical protein YC2023_000773 [Brassica napus]